MSAIAFEDVNAYEDRIYYTHPNEEVLAWRELLKHTPIYRAAGICSAGEVGLFAMLPLVRQELVLVDHSYRSLSIAMLKYLLIREYGWKETKRLLTAATAKDADDLRTALKAVRPQLPEKVGGAYDCLNDPFGGASWGIKPIWKATPNRLLQKSSAKLGQVKFLHGDLTDLANLGPFGLLYISNALEHRSRTGNNPIIKEVVKAVKPGGYVIGCVGQYDDYGVSRKAKTNGWEIVASKVAKNSSIRWTQNLYRLPKETCAA